MFELNSSVWVHELFVANNSDAQIQVMEVEEEEGARRL